MSPAHLVRPAADTDLAKVGGWAASATSYRRWAAVDEAGGSVHTGFGICELDGGGDVPAHLHSFEESFYVVSGSGVVATPAGAVRVSAGDYGLFPVAVPHRWVNPGAEPLRWAEMQSPVPRERHGQDTYLVDPGDVADAQEPAPAPPLDVRDPRTRDFGNITPAHMDPARQSQQLLAVSASMRTALLVYSGITVKMMVDSDLGAELSAMFMVQYDPDGVVGPHDHPFEEAYYFLDGRAEVRFDDETYTLGPGDVAWAGVGCAHAFRNLGDGPLRWLETQAPQPPGRHAYRFARDWDYLREVLG
jgi:mannose-6-phosphate isomerase-like protein (cupin superfamily)